MRKNKVSNGVCTLNRVLVVIERLEEPRIPARVSRSASTVLQAMRTRQQ